MLWMLSAELKGRLNPITVRISHWNIEYTPPNTQVNEISSPDGDNRFVESLRLGSVPRFVPALSHPG